MCPQTGKVLVSLQLLPKEEGVTIRPAPMTVETSPGFVEITAVGARDLVSKPTDNQRYLRMINTGIYRCYRYIPSRPRPASSTHGHRP
jgi:hypothetical protein